MERTLNHSVLLKLKRWNTPTIYNGLEALTRRDRLTIQVNEEETRDFMPQMGPMIGYAATLRIRPSDPANPKVRPDGWSEYRRYIASRPGPAIVVVQDLDKPRTIGSFWGEVNSNAHKALGCVGTITDGAVRDIDEMTNAGFKAIARRLCVGHAWSWPAEWDCPVEVFGTTIRPGDLIHADKHGFIVIPPEDQTGILDAVLFMDNNELDHTIAAARSATGKSREEIADSIMQASAAFRQATKEHFKK
jgi:4-hydroxy-4-methyl-2-oxoglutarate aldolase